MKIKLLPGILIPGIFLLLFLNFSNDKNLKHFPDKVSDSTMQIVYNEIKTPFKYGVVLKHPDSTKLIDSPTIFRENSVWYMTYIIYDGQGYETWLAESRR